MTDYRTFNEVSEKYFTKHPEEVDLFLAEIFEAYAEDEDSAALLSQLRIVARAKGISNLADEIGITRQGLQKALSEKGNPRLNNINALMKAMGYWLTPVRMNVGGLAPRP